MLICSSKCVYDVDFSFTHFQAINCVKFYRCAGVGTANINARVVKSMDYFSINDIQGKCKDISFPATSSDAQATVGSRRRIGGNKGAENSEQKAHQMHFFYQTIQ